MLVLVSLNFNLEVYGLEYNSQYINEYIYFNSIWGFTVFFVFNTDQELLSGSCKTGSLSLMSNSIYFI